MGKPSILFVLSDQQRWDTYACYGRQLAITPNLDRMARVQYCDGEWVADKGA